MSSVGLDALTSESPDVSIVDLKHNPDLVMVSSVDFFSPISLDPLKQGYIAAANALSDLYAVGVTDVDSVLMILGQSTKMQPDQRAIVTRLMMQGFLACCSDAETRCLGGQTVLNPWPLIGGSCSAVLPRSRLLRSGRALPGDLIVLTKPLGTQVAGNLALWMLDPQKWEKVSKHLSEEEAASAVLAAENWMMKLNRGAAQAAVTVGAHGATDITGFGILGHAENLVAIQEHSVDFVLDVLPIIRGLVLVEKGITIDYRLTQGYSAETSGGLFIICPPEAVADLVERCGTAWVIGRVIKGTRRAYLKDACTVIEA